MYLEPHCRLVSLVSPPRATLASYRAIASWARTQIRVGHGEDGGLTEEMSHCMQERQNVLARNGV